MRINGTIDFIELEELKMLIKKMFVGHKVHHKVRVFGDEFKIIDDKYEIYINTFDPTNQCLMKKPRYSIEGEILLSLKESLKEIHRITSSITENKIGYCIAFYPIENEDEVEIELRSIKYYELYEEMKIRDRS